MGVSYNILIPVYMHKEKISAANKWVYYRYCVWVSARLQKKPHKTESSLMMSCGQVRENAYASVGAVQMDFQ